MKNYYKIHYGGGKQHAPVDLPAENPFITESCERAQNGALLTVSGL